MNVDFINPESGVYSASLQLDTGLTARVSYFSEDPIAAPLPPEVSDSWISLGSSGSTGKNNPIYWYNVSIARNTGPERTGTITFRGTGSQGDYGENVLTIYQPGKDVIPGTVEMKNGPLFSASKEAGTVEMRVAYSNSADYSIDQPQGQGLTFTMVNSSSLNGNTRVTWSVDYPANPGTAQRDLSAYFTMTSGSYVAMAEGIIRQAGQPVVIPGNVIVSPSLSMVGSNTTVKTVYVTYQNAVLGGYTILTPSCSEDVTPEVVGTPVSDESHSYYTYSLGFPANGSTTEYQYRETLFRMTGSAGYFSASAMIVQDSASVAKSISCSVDSISTGSAACTASVRVRYNGTNVPSEIDYPVFYIDSAIEGYHSTSVASGDTYLTYDYKIYLRDNLSPEPRYNFVVFGFKASGTPVKSVAISQSAADIPPAPADEPYIEIPNNPSTVASGDQSTYVQVIYKNVSGSKWYPGTPGPGGGTTNIQMVSSEYDDLDLICTYLVEFPANPTYEVITRRAFFNLVDGQGNEIVNGGSAYIYQQGKPDTSVGITVRPPDAYVGSAETSCVFYVTYNMGELHWDIQEPICTTGVGVTEIGSEQTGTNIIVKTYRATFPVNTTNQTVHRRVDVLMTRGSQTSIKSFNIYQDPDTGGGTGTGISVSPGSVSIPATTTRASCTVYYYGISSLSQITTPYTLTDGWVASIGTVRESAGYVEVTWNFTGPENTSNYQRTIAFTIGATGLTSTSFVIYQRAASGGGGDPGPGDVIPIWKRNIISSSLSGATLTVNSGSTVIFQDKIYAEPGSIIPEVDLNRICESFVQQDGLIDPGENGEGDSWVHGSSYPIPVFSASFDSGEDYASYILKDWSYQDNTKSGLLSDVPSADTIKVRFRGNWGRPGYLVATLLNTGSSQVSYDLITPLGSLHIVVNPKSYYDLTYQTNYCGKYYLTGSGQILRTWETVEDSNWMVYFRNKYNGLESLLLKGTVVPSIDVTRNNYLQGVYRYTRSYLNGEVSKWKCNTGIIPDSQSYLVSEMIGATEVVLHDVPNGKKYITRANTNTVEKKTFWNQGRKFATYEFELESILTKLRR